MFGVGELVDDVVKGLAVGVVVEAVLLLEDDAGVELRPKVASDRSRRRGFFALSVRAVVRIGSSMEERSGAGGEVLRQIA